MIILIEHIALLFSLPDDEEMRSLGVTELRNDLLDQTFNMNVEYRLSGDTYVTLHTVEKKFDVAKCLVEDGLLMVDRKVIFHNFFLN